MYARSFSRLALVLVFLYSILVASSAIPVKLLDYSWINLVTATLINGSGLPLVALLVLVLGSMLYPEDQLLENRRQLFCRLASVAALGFLLLVPLNIYTSVIQHLNDREQWRSLESSARQLNAYRNAVTSASNPATLQAGLQKLGAPKLDPVALVAQPLPDLKKRLLLSFDQAGAELAERRRVLSETTNWQSRLINLIRILVACLVIAFGFAAFAQGSPETPPLMDRLEDGVTTIRRQGLWRSLRQRPEEELLGSEESITIAPRRSLRAFLAGAVQGFAEATGSITFHLQDFIFNLNPKKTSQPGKNRRSGFHDDNYFEDIAPRDESES